MPFYLAEYIGSGTRADPFRPVGSDQPGWAAIDLRPDPSVVDGGGLNACLLRTPTAFNDPRARFLADDKLENLTNPQKNFLQNRLGIDLSSTNLLRDIIATLMVHPPNGAWKRLNPGLLWWEIWLGELIWQVPRISGGASDNFNRPNETPLAISAGYVHSGIAGDVDQTIALASNAAQTTGWGMTYGVNAASTANQFSEADVKNRDSGPGVRLAAGASAFNGYTYGAFGGTGHISKFTNGTATDIGTGGSIGLVAATFRIEANGSSLRALVDGVQDVAPITDTSYATGQPGFAAATSASHAVDAWRGGDLPTVAVAFPIVADADDGTGYREAATWAGIGTGTFTAESTPELWISKNSGGGFFDDNTFLEIDTSNLPDMATVVGARLKLYVLSKDDSADNFSVVGDYYHFGGEPSVAADWVITSPLPSIFGAVANEDVTGWTNNAWNYATIYDVGGINKYGYTGIRLTLSDGTPTAANGLSFAGSEDITNPPPTLDIDYVLEGHWARDQARVSVLNVVAYPNDVRAGTLLIACAELDGNEVTSPTVSDSRGNTWTLIRNTVTGNNQTIAWWYAVSNGAGPCSVTFDNPSNFKGYIIAEFSTDLSGTISLDVQDTVYRSTVGAGVDKFTTASVSAGQADSLAVSFLGTDTGGISDLVAGTDCILDGQGDLSNSATDRLAMEHRVVGAGSVALPWTTASDFGGQVHVAIFRVATSGPAPAFHSAPPLIF